MRTRLLPLRFYHFSEQKVDRIESPQQRHSLHFSILHTFPLF
ncbi:unnamed protein product [Tenebrio molitor]|nr:unnamed protein product [Tenebrio molitor]